MMEDKIITIVITEGDYYGDVSFQDEYSAKVFDNIYRSMYEECGVVDLHSDEDSDWHDYRDNRSSGKLTHTMRYHILEEETMAVVEMLRTMYDVTIVDIQFEEDTE